MPPELTIEPALEQAAGLYLRQRIAAAVTHGVQLVDSVSRCRNLLNGPMCVPCVLLSSEELRRSVRRDFKKTHDSLELVRRLEIELGVPCAYAQAITDGIYGFGPPKYYRSGYWLGLKLFEEFGPFPDDDAENVAS